MAVGNDALRRGGIGILFENPKGIDEGAQSGRGTDLMVAEHLWIIAWAMMWPERGAGDESSRIAKSPAVCHSILEFRSLISHPAILSRCAKSRRFSSELSILVA